MKEQIKELRDLFESTKGYTWNTNDTTRQEYVEWLEEKLSQEPLSEEEIIKSTLDYCTVSHLDELVFDTADFVEWYRTQPPKEPLSDEEIRKAFIAGRNSNDLYARLKGIPTSATEYLDNCRTQQTCNKPLNKGFSASDSTEQPPKDEVVKIDKWKMVKIEDTLRQVSNIFHSHTKETAVDRCVIQSQDWCKQALKGGEE